MTLKHYSITQENYLLEVHHLHAVANCQRAKDGKELRKKATKIKAFFETPLSELETPGCKRIGLKFKDRVIFRWYDRSKAETSRLREWEEFMLIAEDGNHYELGEISDSGRRLFPLLGQDEILERASKVRSENKDEPTSTSGEWEDTEAETNSSIWRAWNEKVKLGKQV